MENSLPPDNKNKRLQPQKRKKNIKLQSVSIMLNYNPIGLVGLFSYVDRFSPFHVHPSPAGVKIQTFVFILN